MTYHELPKDCGSEQFNKDAAMIRHAVAIATPDDFEEFWEISQKLYLYLGTEGVINVH